MIKKKGRHKPLYKKFIRLRTHPQNNYNKLLKTIVKLESYKKKGKKYNEVTVPISSDIPKFKKEKWSNFLNFIIRKNAMKKTSKFFTRKTGTFFTKLKPYSFNFYSTSKFASPGNSFKKKFKNNLLAKKTFNYFYGGGLLKKYLKNRMTEIYRSKKHRNPMKTCIEFFESRLDSVIYRSKFSYSMKNARQLIAHKHIKVNNQIEKNKSYILKQGDLISINTKSIEIVKKNLNKQFKERPDSILWPMSGNYLNINYNTLEIVFGDIKNFDFSTSFTFKLDTNSIITSHYRH